MSEEQIPYEAGAAVPMKRPEALDTLRELAEKAPGELRYWPTHYAGTTPYIIVSGEGERETRLFVAQNREGKTADTELSGSEGDRAIAYAKRMTEAANALPDILAYVAHLEGALDHIRSLDEDTMHLDRPMMERMAVLFSTALAVANEALGWPPAATEQTPAESRPTE